MRKLWNLLVHRWKLRQANGRQRWVDEGRRHERRRVLHLLNNMQPDHDPTWERGITGSPAVDSNLAATLVWTEGWTAAQERAIQLVEQRRRDADSVTDIPGW